MPPEALAALKASETARMDQAAAELRARVISDAERQLDAIHREYHETMAPVTARHIAKLKAA
jgi:hypothetical protein